MEKERVKENRSLGMYILLTIVTCGIYSLYFTYTMAKDANTLCEGDGKKTTGLLMYILLSLVTCGIYAIYWDYSLGNRLAENAPRYGLTFQENGSSVLLWRIFGILLCGIGPFIAENILIKNMNSLAHVYNQNIQPVSGNVQQNMQTAGNVQQNMQAAGNVQQNVQAAGSMKCCRGMYEGAEFPIQGEVIIGRDEAESNIVIKNSKISRKHCGVRFPSASGAYLVTDYSMNGVFYKNGQAFPKNEPVECTAGTIIVIADSGNEFLLQ